MAKQHKHANGEFTHPIASCIIATALAATMITPAFAANAPASNEATNTVAATQSNSADEAKGAKEAGSDTKAKEDKVEAKGAKADSKGIRPAEVINETKELKPADDGSKPAKAEVSSDQAKEDAVEEEPEDTETCLWWRDGNTWITSRGGSDMTITNALAFGVDVSVWQPDIDWARAKESGVQFAILRCAYGSPETGHPDEWFKHNVDGCIANDIPFGVYVYSEASTVEEGAIEAQFVLDILADAGVTPLDMTYPVYFDMESDNNLKLDATGRGDLAELFCNTIQAAGFTPGIYANASWLTRHLTDPRFEQWTIWAASYPTTGYQDATSSYEGKHDIWQCMSRGIVDGIPGRVDINFDYRFAESAYAAIYDYEYYIQNNPDVAEACGGSRTKAFMHFLNSGMAEGRRTSPTFNLHAYYNSNADLRHEFGFDFKQYYVHYMQTNAYEVRPMANSMVPKNMTTRMNMLDFSSKYNPLQYLADHPEVADEFTCNANGELYIDDAGLFRHFIANL